MNEMLPISRGRAPDGRSWNTMTEADRFLAKIDSSAGPEGCWPWTGDKTALGYPKMNGQYVHRLVAGAQDGEVARHSCDNPPCVNPAHLLVGTMADNVADMMTRGRHVSNSATSLAKPTCRRGHPRTPELAHIESGTWRCDECRRMNQRKNRS